MIYTTYSYDNVGNRISKEVKKTDQNVRTNYTYNELNQLTTESEEGKSDINYSYDANSNLAAKNDGETTLTYSYTVEDRLQAVKEGNRILMAAIYDGNGDRVFTLRPSKNPPAETLIRMNNPKTGDDIIVYIAIFVAAVVVIIMFNSKNEKVKKAGIGLLVLLLVAGSATIITINSNKENESYTPNVPSNKEARQINENMIFIPFGVNENDQNRYELTQYINDVTTQNTQVLMEYSNESGITAYTYGNERLSYETNGVNYKYNYDGRGSVTNLLDSTDTSVVEYNYQPFGETEIIGTKAQELENTYQFNAESTDALTGLQYLRARYYDSKTGRFTSADTYLGEITDPLSRNLYLYTKNDPVNYVDPSGHIFETIMQMADTAKNLYQKASEEAIQKIETSNFIPSAMKTALKTAINTQVSKTINKYENRKSTTKPTIETVIENIKKNEPASPSRQAAINEKVEYAKALEQKIKECRSLNTMEANRIAEELEYQMRLLCDDNLDKVDVQKSAEKITSIVMESVQRKMQETSDTGFSAVVGFASTLVLDTVEFAGGMWFAISYGLQGKDMGEGYSFFSNKVDTVRNLIEENVPDKQAYNVGEITGNVVEIFQAGKGIYKLATKGIPQIKNIVKMFPAGGNGGTAGTAVLSKTLAIVGELAESVTTVGVVAEGTAAEVTFAEKLAGNIQEYSGTGNGGNETGNATGGSGENTSDVNKSKEILLNKEANYDSATKTLIEEIDKTGAFKTGSNKYIGRLKSSYGYEKQIGRESLDGKVRWRLDYDDKIGVHYNIEDFSNGKGINAVKKVIPIDISYNDYKKIIDLWN